MQLYCFKFLSSSSTFQRCKSFNVNRNTRLMFWILHLHHLIVPLHDHLLELKGSKHSSSLFDSSALVSMPKRHILPKHFHSLDLYSHCHLHLLCSTPCFLWYSIQWLHPYRRQMNDVCVKLNSSGLGTIFLRRLQHGI